MIPAQAWRRSVLALAFLAATAAAAFAQGAFYREVMKDGRIYVFNNMRSFEQFDTQGEAGKVITREGYGPNGETVVFDSEEAIHLYNFKHGRPGEVRLQPSPSPPPTVSWRDGTTTVLFPGLAQIRINNRVQARFTDEFPGEQVQLPGTREPGDHRPSFRIRRAKFKLEGWIYKTWLTYEVQLNWPAISGSNPGALLEDAYLNWDFSRGERRLMARLGQYKVPFGRQQLTSSGSQQLVDRSAVSDQYARGRDLGFQVWGVAWNNKVEWRLGAFNGNGLTRVTNDNDTLQYNARVMFQPTGAIPLGTGSGPLYSEADFESTDRPLWALAVNYEHNDLHRTTSAVDLQDDIWAFDYTFKWRRFCSVGELHLREREPEPAAPGAAATPFDSDGWFVQAGYLLDRGRRWEVAGRYGTFDPTSLRAGDDQRELRAGLSYYHNRHALKAQLDFGVLRNLGTGADNKELRFQTQFVF